MPPKHGGHHGGHHGGGGHGAHGPGPSKGVQASVQEIHKELESLRKHGLVSEGQFKSIMAQLPEHGEQSQYTDPRYGGHELDPSAISQAAQDPNHPAHPSHPKHSQWATGLGKKLGNAAIFGAGATAGGHLVNSII